MIRIYYANSGVFQKEVTLDQMLASLPFPMQEKARRYRFEKDAYNYALGRLLLRKRLIETGHGAEKLENITYNPFGKPELDFLSFNISHSENVVIFACSDRGRVGIDIELSEKIDIQHFKDWFTREEWAEIHAADPPEKVFFTYWMLKESVLKASGEGLSRVKDIVITDKKRARLQGDGEKWYLQMLLLEERYPFALCTEEEVPDIQVTYITPETI